MKLRVFKNKTHRRIFGEWRRIDSEELHSFYCSTNISRVIKSRGLGWTDHLARTEECRSAFKILTGKRIEKRLSRRPSCKWEDNTSVKEIGINTRNWVDLTQDRNYWSAVVNATLNLQVPQAKIICIHVILRFFSAESAVV